MFHISSTCLFLPIVGLGVETTWDIPGQKSEHRIQETTCEVVCGRGKTLEVTILVPDGGCCLEATLPHLMGYDDYILLSL